MQVLACALLYDLGAADDGIRCGELAAFCVAPGFRGSGRGDSLLDYVEQVCHLPSGVSILLQLHLPPPCLCTPGPVLGRSVVLAVLSRCSHEAGGGPADLLVACLVKSAAVSNDSWLWHHLVVQHAFPRVSALCQLHIDCRTPCGPTRPCQTP